MRNLMPLSPSPVSSHGLVAARRDHVLQSDRAVFAGPHVKSTLLLTLLEPLVQAGGTALVLAGAKRASSGTDATAYVAAFAAASLLLPGIAQRAASVKQKHWLGTSHRDYDASFVAHDYDRPALWALDQKGLNNERASRTFLFGARLRWGVANEVNAARDLSRAVIELGVAMVLFSATIGVDVCASFAVSAALLASFGHLALGRAVTRQEAISQCSGELDGHLRNYYDNVELGNQNNYDRWQRQLLQLTSQKKTLENEQAQSDAMRGLLVLGLARAPVMAALALRLSNLEDPSARAAVGRDIILQLPYLFQTTQRLVGCGELLSRQFLPARASLLNILRESRTTPALDLHSRIQGDQIKVQVAGRSRSFTEAWPDLLMAAEQADGGRFLLTGDNGKGKSMALLALKQAMGASASMLLPADLRELSFSMRQGSTGERVLSALRSAIDEGPSVLLLDEWEAHLDENNRNACNQALDWLTTPRSKEGAGRVVVEVSHRRR